jgi:hypothetical protein
MDGRRPAPGPFAGFSNPQHQGVCIMAVNIVLLQPLVALIGGILILAVPRLLNYVVAIYLILIGVIGLFPHLMS